MGQGDLWVLVIARMGRWDVGDDEYWDTMLNGREGPSATPWVHAASMVEKVARTMDREY